MRIGGDNHKAVRLVRAQPLGGLASLPDVHKTGTADARSSDFLPGPSGPSAAVSTTSTTWPGEMSWIEAGSAMRSGTAAVAGAVPVSRPGPRSWASVGICPFRRGEASCFPPYPVLGESAPAGTPSGRTSRGLRSESIKVDPAGRSRAAARTVTRCSEGGVSWWTAIPAATHSRRATTRRRLWFSQPAKRRCPDCRVGAPRRPPALKGRT